MQKQTDPHQELLPPLERPLDKASIDGRMKAQAPFEGVKARQFELDDVSASNSRGKKLAKLGAVAAATSIAIPLVGRAMDHEFDSGKPSFPPPSGQVEKPEK
jgi:hypothetical protein